MKPFNLVVYKVQYRARYCSCCIIKSVYILVCVIYIYIYQLSQWRERTWMEMFPAAGAGGWFGWGTNRTTESVLKDEDPQYLQVSSTRRRSRIRF